jgi:hypothetical protein
VLAGLLAVGLLAAAGRGEKPRVIVGPDRNVVLWISLDGVRSDYLSARQTPFLHSLMEQGLYSRRLEPVFPSITFPSHVSQATGVQVKHHGVPGNRFFDSTTGQEHRYPTASELIQAEPIWITASGQGVRVAVHDWPLSYAQEGPATAVYFGHGFDPTLSDEIRAQRLLETWKADRGDRPLRLLMGYLGATDRAGHQFGPDSPQVELAMRQTDQLVERIVHQARKIVKRQAPGHVLYVLLTTDHGMAAVHTAVHLGRLAGVEGLAEVRAVSNGCVGDLFFAAEISHEQRQAQIAGARQAVAQYPFARLYDRQSLPPAWGYDHPQRVGDLIVVLEPGYTFSDKPHDITAPVQEIGGPRGMHGYDPAAAPQMLGPLILWRDGEGLGGRDLGPVHGLQLHATVAGLLGIKPSPAAAGAIKVTPFGGAP